LDWEIICLTGVDGIWYHSVYVCGKVGCPDEGNWIVAQQRAGGSCHVDGKIEIVGNYYQGYDCHV